VAAAYRDKLWGGWEPGRQPSPWRRAEAPPSANDLALTPVRGAAAFFILAYLFFLFSRILDLGLSSLHLPLVLSFLGLCAVFITNTYLRAVSSKIGHCLLGMTFWMLLATPFSSWPGGSVNMLTGMWFKSLAVFLMVAALLRSGQQLSRAISIVAVAVLCSAVIGITKGAAINGRIFVAGTGLSDSNDFGLFLLLSLPMWLYLLTKPGASIIRRMMCLGCILVILGAMAHTGSRGTMLGLCAVGLAAFLTASMGGKFKMLACTAGIVLFTVAVTPHDVLQRYTTFFNGDQQDEEEVAAVGSTEGRTYLLKESLWFTVRHPLLGVGPGMFMVAENQDALNAGQIHGSWHETHNMYTEVSSECGIPAFCFFLAAICYAFKGINRVRRLRVPATDPRAEMVRLAGWLWLSMVGVCTSGFFLSIAYTPLIPVLGGLVVALEKCVAPEPAPVLQLLPARAPTVRMRLEPSRL
jgi:O-antigen ligase